MEREVVRIGRRVMRSAETAILRGKPETIKVVIGKGVYSITVKEFKEALE